MSRNCPEGLKNTIFGHFWDNFLPIWSMLLFGDLSNAGPLQPKFMPISFFRCASFFQIFQDKELKETVAISSISFYRHVSRY